ncbi:MAG: phosphoserine phosphatase SerB [Methylovirgula sp.]
MTHVATLVSDPRGPMLGAPLLAHVAAMLPLSAGPHWLDESVAADIFFTPPLCDESGLRDLTSALRGKLAQVAIDVIVQPVAHRRKKLFVADMDSTMIGQECLDELADYIGLKPVFSKITEAAMQGEIAFEPALRQRIELLAGLDIAVIDKILAERITLTPGGRMLVATMRAHGAVTALVSSGLTFFTQPIAARLGFDRAYGNVLIVEDGKFSGRVAEPVLGHAAKRETLEQLRNEYGFVPEETLAVGDGANDLDMLGAAGLGVAFHGKPVVAAAAQARIEHGDLTALLYAQGFSRKEFCTQL